MFDWLARNHPEDLIGVLAVLGSCLIALTAIIASQWRKARQAEVQLRQLELEASLKHEMVSRGMSATEICQVLAGRLSGSSEPLSAMKRVARSVTSWF